MRRLRVSDNRRFLVYEAGRPFFYLGDTAWELFHRLDRQEADTYLQDRAAKRFTVIQAVVLAEREGLTVPNAYGHLPLRTNPAEDHPSAFTLDNGHLDDYDVRKGLYWALFSGACGHTYGCHDIWQMWQEGREPATFTRTPWYKALHLPGSAQVQRAVIRLPGVLCLPLVLITRGIEGGTYERPCVG